MNLLCVLCVQNEQLCDADVPEAGDGVYVPQTVHGAHGRAAGHRTHSRTGSGPSSTGQLALHLSQWCLTPE